jgi:hypothetical protein
MAGIMAAAAAVALIGLEPGLQEDMSERKREQEIHDQI